MRIIAKRTLREFWRKHPDSEEQLKSWYSETSKMNWEKPNDIKQEYPKASIIGNNRVVFNISGNRYRLVVKVNYIRGWILIRFIGTHNEYDRVNVEVI